jgi:hypothetical protein
MEYENLHGYSYNDTRGHNEIIRVSLILLSIIFKGELPKG